MKKPIYGFNMYHSGKWARRHLIAFFISFVMVLSLIPAVPLAAADGSGAAKKQTDLVSGQVSISKDKILALKEKITSLPDAVQAPPDLYIEIENGVRTLKKYKLPDDAAKAMAAAEDLFQNKDYDGAIKGYLQVIALAPYYSTAYCDLADSYYTMGDLKNAKKYFLQAISRNFINYQAHWFLADTLWKLGDSRATLEELTLAHVLNPGHKDIFRILKDGRAKIGRPWQSWEFIPQCKIYKSGDKLIVEADPDWAAYALIKSMYMTPLPKMLGVTATMNTYEGRTDRYAMEYDAIRALSDNSDKFGYIAKIKKAGYFEEFVLYEALANRDPSEILTLDTKKIMRVVEYVNKYH